tara:strand:+ start:775 stop:1179 length:405 start_codon:yes stop_codon:yes gene_type:complete
MNNMADMMVAIPTDNYDDDSYDEEAYTKLLEQIDSLFPNAPFSFRAEDVNILDEVLVDCRYALIYQNRTCYCVGDKDPTPIIITINSYNNKNITYRNFYEEVQLKWDKHYQSCNHDFLESISIKNNIIELGFGS